MYSLSLVSILFWSGLRLLRVVGRGFFRVVGKSRYLERGGVDFGGKGYWVGAAWVGI